MSRQVSVVEVVVVVLVVVGGVGGRPPGALTLNSCFISRVSGCRCLQGRLRRCVWYR